MGESPHPTPDTRTVPRVARVTGAAVLVFAVLVGVGWVVDVRTLTALGASDVTVKLNTAVGLGAVAGYLLVPRSRLGPALAMAAAAIGVLTLVQPVMGVELGLDELVVRDPDPGTAPPGRMALATAAGLAGLGVAQLFLWAGRARVAQALLTVPGALATLALLGRGFDVEALYGIGPYARMAESTAISLTALVIGTAACVPGGLIPWLLLDRGLGAGLARRLLPVVLFVIPAIAFLTLQGAGARLWDERFAHALMAGAIGLVFVTVTLVVAHQLDGVDAQRATVLQELADLNESLREGRDAEWRRAEALTRDLEEQQQQFRRAISKVDDLVWTVEVTPDGPEPVELVFASPNATGVFGGDIPDGPRSVDMLLRLLHPDDLVTTKEFLDAVTDGRPAEAEVRVRGLDGNERWLWVRGAPRRVGTHLFCDGIATNVTERQELAQQREEMLRREQEQVRSLRELNRMREEFLAVAGHELRSPLTSVLGFAELLLEDETMTGEQRRHAKVIVERTHQLTELVGDMFDLTRLESGLVQLELRPTDVAAVVADAVEAHRPSAAEAGVTITPSLEPATVDLDPVRFRQMMDNLLANAVRYSRTPGEVHVDLRTVGPAVVLTVADDGIGIPDGEHERVFDRLYRATNATRQGIRGTGLGLALTKAIVEAHHGTISVRPNDPQGSVFEVWLPLTAA